MFMTLRKGFAFTTFIFCLIVWLFGCARKNSSFSEHHDLNDPKVRQTCLDEAMQVLDILREEKIQIPDVYGQAPQKIKLTQYTRPCDLERDFDVVWTGKLMMSLTTGGEVKELINLESRNWRTTDVTPLTTAKKDHSNIRSSITTSTLHEINLRLLKRLKPLTWQNYKVKAGFPRIYQLYMNGLYVENGTVFIDWKQPDFVLQSYMDLSHSGAFPSMSDLKIDRQTGAKVAMNYLNVLYGRRTQMVVTHHEILITNRAETNPKDLHIPDRTDDSHLRLCHRYSIWSEPRPMFGKPAIGYYLDYVYVDAVEGKVVGHSHPMLISGPPPPNECNFYLARYPK